MKTPAIVSTLTVVGSLAFAAGQSQGTRAVPDAEKPLQGESLEKIQSLGLDCSPPTQNWFADYVWRINECDLSLTFLGTPSTNPLDVLDINGDGKLDYVRLVSSNLADNSQPVLIHSQVGYDNWNGQAIETHVPVSVREVVVPFLNQWYPNFTVANISARAWRDIDNDGDLDLALLIFVLFPDWGGSQTTFTCWLKNIGYEKPTPPLAADLNHDGNVDGIDLGMLLASWGAHS